MKKLISLLVVAVGLIGCSKDNYVRVQSLVSSYYKIGEIGVKALSANDWWEIQLDLDKDIANWTTGEYQFLCEKHGDTSFNRRINIAHNMGGGNIGYDYSYGVTAPTVDFVSIDIVSDADYDEQHPAGSNLGNIVKLFTVSPYRYIQSGYTELFDWDNYDGIKYGFLTPEKLEKGMVYPVEKMVCDLTPDDLILVGNRIRLISSGTQPTLSKVHNITITLNGSNGLYDRVYTVETTLNFQ